MTQRYFVGTDDSGHDYLIPLEQHEDWSDFINSEERLSYGDVPDYAEYIDGGTLTFTDPKIEKLE